MREALQAYVERVGERAGRDCGDEQPDPVGPDRGPAARRRPAGGSFLG